LRDGRFRNSKKLLPQIARGGGVRSFWKTCLSGEEKIFATLWLEEKRAVLKLSPADQDFYCVKYSFIFPVKGAWGKYGWTNIDLNKTSELAFSESLTSAWLNVAPKTLAKKHGLNSPNH
jgi:hypothetical protein